MSFRTRALLVTIALALPVTVSPASAADADVFVLQGRGTISPGLGFVPEPQSVTFVGTMTAVGTRVLATYNCTFSGNDIAGSIWESAGTLSGSCGPWRCDLITYFRFGAAMSMTCLANLVGPSGHWKCVFTPDNLLPTTDYEVLCQGAVAIAP